MIVHLTKRMKEMSKLPTQLDFKKSQKNRGLLNPTELKEYDRLKRGSVGEANFLEFIEVDGLDHWIVLQNLWLIDGRSFECDVILLTSHCVYVFEIKNYRGHFKYEDGSCTINNLKMEYDCIQQARKAYLKVRRICNYLSPSIHVKGALVFIGERNKVSINSPVSDIVVLSLTDLYEYIQEIKREEQSGKYRHLDVQQFIHHLEQYEMTDPFLPEPLSKEEVKKARRGVYCANCGRYDLVREKNYFICLCGLHEPREEAIVRTACEYGVLTYGSNFSTRDIRNFMDKQGSHVHIKEVLNKHFDYTANHRFSYHHNKNLLYYEFIDQFAFSLPRKHYKSRSNTEISYYN